jgi:hypothetical protein
MSKLFANLKIMGGLHLRRWPVWHFLFTIPSNQPFMTPLLTLLKKTRLFKKNSRLFPFERPKVLLKIPAEKPVSSPEINTRNKLMKLPMQID